MPMATVRNVPPGFWGPRGRVQRSWEKPSSNAIKLDVVLDFTALLLAGYRIPLEAVPCVCRRRLSRGVGASVMSIKIAPRP